ncbi:hypothetical protein AWB74_06258 [Caballeronia arvi]|uniref:Uncharacterized protein n=1 Tax=Caballeronia arvi TaxID=1777135 RepID=A0A158KMQ5_9BURK|nr:hypothetical protein [Caballeronia arvi]SAL82402.1 hypothetical protein AWB74_06258 [Caballeronia arvi]
MAIASAEEGIGHEAAGWTQPFATALDSEAFDDVRRRNTQSVEAGGVEVDAVAPTQMFRSNAGGLVSYAKCASIAGFRRFCSGSGGGIGIGGAMYAQSACRARCKPK